MGNTKKTKPKPKPLTIFVKNLTGLTKELKIMDTNTIQDVEIMCNKEFKLEYNKTSQLIYENKELKLYDSIRMYSIKDNETLHVKFVKIPERCY